MSIPGSSRTQVNAVPVLVFMTALCTGLSCREEPPAAPEVPAKAIAPAAPVEVLVFPDRLRVDDALANEFVERAMKQCAAGDYAKFRLLWSARGDLLTADEYDQGWQAVREIRVRALERVQLAADPQRGREQAETVYALLAEVSLDPTHRAAQEKPNRDVALMLVKEHGQWRLARAPSEMRKWLREKVAEDSE